MLKFAVKSLFYLFLLSFTPIPLILFMGYLLVYKDGAYAAEIKTEVLALWQEMIVRYELYYLEELLMQTGIALMVFLVIILHFSIMLKYRKRKKLQAIN